MSQRSLGRLGGRQRRLAAAQRAYGTLAPAQRCVLVLRYVDDLPTDVVARRLGLSEPRVEELLVEARAALLRTPPKPFLRPLAAAAAVAALALTLPHAPAPGGASPAQAAPLPGAITYVVGGDALALASDSAAVPAAAAAPRDGRLGTPRDLPPGGGGDVRVPPRSTCRSVCLPRTPKSGDSVRIAVPDGLHETVGTSEVALEQEHIPFCGAMPSAPNAMARCVPGSA